MQIKKAEALRVLAKFRFEIRSGKERFAKFYYQDTLILTTSIPQGKGDMYVSNQFRQQLKLNLQQLKDAINCPLKYDEYVEHLKRIGQIEN
jgi:hypothetical protein